MKYFITSFKFFGGLAIGIVVGMVILYGSTMVLSSLGINTSPDISLALIIIAIVLSIIGIVVFSQSVAKRKGWNLKSLYIGVSIGIVFFFLSLVLLASVNVKRGASDDLARVVGLKQIKVALEIYFDYNGKYPDTLEELMQAQILTQMPVDPKSSDLYFYKNIINTDLDQSYVLSAQFENEDYPALNVDIDGVVFGHNCEDPIYCVGPQN